LRAGVIGLGSMGGNHARVYGEIEGVELAAVADPDGERLRRAGRGGSVSGYRDFRRMLAEERLDLVSVAVPTGLHLDVALAAIERGAAVLVEKPIASSVEEGWRMVEAAREAGYRMPRSPQVALAADPTLARHEVRVVAWHGGRPLESTQAMRVQEGSGFSPLPKGAFFIIDGKGHFTLDLPVVNIGRRLDNQLVLDDPRVSRTHAQLRARQGRYVIFDLASKAGTLVNGRAITEWVLRSGDVVTIATTRLVYGEDPEGPPEDTSSYTPPFPVDSSSDRPTPPSGWGDTSSP
jgi:hypothetical protein